VAKLILVSILIATVAVPLQTSKTPSAVLGLRRMVLTLLAFEVLYLAALLFVYPRL
jgi:hypothetical protein